MARGKRHLIQSLLLLAVGMVAGWWLTRQGLPLLEGWRKAAEPAQAGDIRRVDFRNFTYSTYCEMVGDQPLDIVVRDGEFARKDPGDPFYFNVQSVNYGDLTGDGQAEAVIVTLCNTGGTGFVWEGLVYTLREGQPGLLTRLESGDRATGIASALIENGQLRVERYAVHEDDPLCCPRYIESMSLRWNGKRLVLEGGVTRRLADPDKNRR